MITSNLNFITSHRYFSSCIQSLSVATLAVNCFCWRWSMLALSSTITWCWTCKNWKKKVDEVLFCLCFYWLVLFTVAYSLVFLKGLFPFFETTFLAVRKKRKKWNLFFFISFEVVVDPNCQVYKVHLLFFILPKYLPQCLPSVLYQTKRSLCSSLEVTHIFVPLLLFFSQNCCSLR